MGILVAITFYNYLTRRKEEFTPLHDPFVGMYVCGPTVYDLPHLGHAKTYVAFDTIVRYLRHRGYRVLYIQNITDVGHLTDELAGEGEDKIIARARLRQVHPMQLAETYTREYFRAMDALGVLRPDISPRAAGHIPEIIALVLKLIEKGHAYESNGSVYFDVSTFPEYGKLSHREVTAASEEESRVGQEEKRHPADFAIWKRADPEHILQWPSPWGMGFPGWHIECSAMANKYLGATMDIHGGGIENIFPHNEDEIAQSEAANDAPYVRYWLLTGSLKIGGQKMSKSLGNFVTIEQALETLRRRSVSTCCRPTTPALLISRGTPSERYRPASRRHSAAWIASTARCEPPTSGCEKPLPPWRARRLRTPRRWRRAARRAMPSSTRRWMTTATPRAPSPSSSRWRPRSTALSPAPCPPPAPTGRLPNPPAMSCASWQACLASWNKTPRRNRPRPTSTR